MEFRGIDRSEYPALLELLEEVNIAPQEYFSNIYLNDPYEDPLLSRVAVDDGRFVSHVRVFPRPHNGGDALWSGGIANVGTLPEYRERGLCRRLLEDSIALMRERGVQYSTVLSGVPVYGKCGWEEIPRVEFSVTLTDTRPRLADQLRVRRFVRERDLAAVASIYAEFNEERPLSVRRSPEYWTAHLGFTIESPELFLVVEDGDVIVAYMRAHEHGERVTCFEAAARRGCEGAYAAFAWVFSRYARRLGWHTVRLRLPADHELPAALAAVHEVEKTTAGHLWMRVVDLQSLFDSFAPVWNRRLARAGAAGRMSVGIRCAGQEARLELDAAGASAAGRSAARRAAAVELNQRELFEFVFGTADPARSPVYAAVSRVEADLLSVALAGPAPIYWGPDDV